MKKYRLIKQYPGSAELDAIAEYQDPLLQLGYFTHKIVSLNNTTFGYINEPEKYPEFWQEVVEKDYEILSFVNNGKYGGQKGFIVPLQKDGLYYAKGYTKSDDDKSLKGSLEAWYLDIHSVKRLSDGEIFTIGDNTKDGCIDKFYIKNDYLLATTVLESFGRHLHHLEKIKQPLFKTEDGVDIFEGDYYYPVEKLYYFLHEKQTNHHCTSEEKFWIFSIKEKAEEYILMNKPCLSLKEVLDVVTFLDRSEKKLKELVKQKLNKNN